MRVRTLKLWTSNDFGRRLAPILPPNRPQTRVQRSKKVMLIADYATLGCARFARKRLTLFNSLHVCVLKSKRLNFTTAANAYAVGPLNTGNYRLFFTA